MTNTFITEKDKHLAQIKALAGQEQPDAAVRSVMDYLKEKRPDFYWVGVYLLKGEMLHVGPYNGPVTDHVQIPVGRGVCGTAVAEDRNQVVDDVTSRDNYLACNIHTRSEIVVLIRDQDDRVLGQIDIDSTKVKAFSADDEAFLTEVAALLQAPVRVLQSQLS